MDKIKLFQEAREKLKLIYHGWKSVNDLSESDIMAMTKAAKIIINDALIDNAGFERLNKQMPKGYYLTQDDDYLMSKYFIEQIEDNSIDGENDKQAPAPDTRTIVFDSQETINKLHEVLKDKFKGHEDGLLRVLNGEQTDIYLLWPGQANTFIELFKRLKYNRYILTTGTQIESFIFNNFQYRDRQGNPKQFNKNTIHDVLTKEGSEPAKKSRLDIPWLPYKTASQRRHEDISEQI